VATSGVGEVSHLKVVDARIESVKPILM